MVPGLKVSDSIIKNFGMLGKKFITLIWTLMCYQVIGDLEKI